MTNDEWLAAEAEWKNPANWRWLGHHYVAPRDPRIWVRKRNPERGWTLNFAHRPSWYWLTAILAIPIAILLILILRS
jgi:uncharacterized membrane protein